MAISAKKLSVTIDGTDRVSSIPADSISISHIAGQGPTCSFVVEDGGGLGLDTHQTVVIATENGLSITWFSGYITRLTETERQTKLDYVVECEDKSYDLKHPEALVNAEYAAQTDQAIIQSFMATTNPSMDVATYVDAIATIERIEFNNVTPFAALTELAKRTGAWFYVDTANKLHYRAILKASGTTTGTTASKLVDSGATFQTDNVQINDYVENITDNTYAQITAVDSETQLSLDTDIFTSGEAYEIWSSSSLAYTLTDDVANAPAGPNAIGYSDLKKIKTGKSVTKIVATGRDGVTATVTGSQINSRHLVTKVVDMNVESVSEATKRAQQLLDDAAEDITYACTIRDGVCWPGDRVRLINALRGVNRFYRVTRSTWRFLENAFIENDLELGRYNARIFEDLQEIKEEIGHGVDAGDGALDRFEREHDPSGWHRFKEPVQRCTGTATTNTTYKLVDTGATFVTDGVIAGDLAVNTTDDTWATVIEVESETSLLLAWDPFPDGNENYSVIAGVGLYHNVGETGTPTSVHLLQSLDRGLVTTGTTTSTTASKLVDSGATFVGSVVVGHIAENTTDNTWAIVTAVDSNTQLSLSDDIFVSGESYRIHRHDLAHAYNFEAAQWEWWAGAQIRATLDSDGNVEINGDITSSLGDMSIIAAANQDLILKMGDTTGLQKVSFRDLVDVEVASINSDGKMRLGAGAFLGTQSVRIFGTPATDTDEVLEIKYTTSGPDNLAQFVIYETVLFDLTYGDSTDNFYFSLPSNDGTSYFIIQDNSDTSLFWVNSNGDVNYIGSHPAASGFGADGSLKYDIENPTLQQTINDLYTLIELQQKQFIDLRRRFS